ncbi:MAG: hypothetical protein AAFP89_25325 [Bacteroidota bacterium]
MSVKKLSPNWFWEGTQDFEYKKYLLLAYLQYVSREFAEVRLYPSFQDLIFHYNNLRAFRDEKQKLNQQFPHQINEEEFRKQNLVKDPLIEDSPQFQEINSIITYALPEIKHYLEDGKGIYDFIDENLQIEPVGIRPLYLKEGYLLLRMNPRKEVRAFEYKVVFLENVGVNYHGISMNPVRNFRYSIANTYEAMKRELIRDHQKFVNPATFLVHAVQPFPEASALLPITKRKVLHYLKSDLAA